MWRLLNSKRFAIYLLLLLTALLVVSTFFPNYYTLGESQWYELEKKRPYLFWFSSHFSTPFLVTNPAFLAISFFLFLSTMVCTMSRLNTWFKSRESEFIKEKAFSFSLERTSSLGRVAIESKIEGLLIKGKWEIFREQNRDRLTISGQKGMSGFWGSVIFHAGLVVCFVAGPVSVLTTFRGELLITEGLDVPLRHGFYSHVGKDPSTLPDFIAGINDFRAQYYGGKFKYDFGGTLLLRDGNVVRDFPFAVNQPAVYRGYQFSLHEYGYSPHVILKKEGKIVFEYYLNLKHPGDGDYFVMGNEGLRALVMFFPDFVREGGRIGTSSMIPKNPVIMIKVFRDNTEIFRDLFKPGESRTFEGYSLVVPDFKYWVNLIVVRESGIIFIIIGCALGLAGLLTRFLSNERRLEFSLSSQGAVSLIQMKGYSRYYPAFLEREVLQMARMIGEGQDDAF